MATIDYYFYGGSPFSYLGHKAFVEMAARCGAAVNFKPVNLMTLWAVSGAVPPAQRPPVRQRYRLVELQRIGERRGLPINVKPKHWPTDTTLADSAVIVIAQTGGDPADYMQKVFAGVWADDLDLADRAVVERLLAGTGFDAADIIGQAQSERVAAVRDRFSQEAVAADAIGVPAYVLDGEAFWGQDRIGMLERALVSGRAPYRA